VPASVDSAEKKHHKKAKHKDISSYVKLKANDFKVGLFGGIKNLELTVSNSSDELIDKVSVVVDILKPSGAILESKSFQFYELRPYSIQMISVPATKRGVKVHYYITNIVSRQVKAEIKMV
jgi:serine/threonine-protein kinase